MINKIKINFKIKIEEEKADYGRFVIEPLEQGYGQTLGNALRRCLLSSLPGAAITQVRIKGTEHRFSTLAGLREDIVEFILNLKQIRFAYRGEKKVKATLEAKGKGVVKAKDIEVPAEVKIINRELELASLADKKSKLEVEMWINSGYGYSPSEERPAKTLGIISVDAIFSPVTKVTYRVETTRVGRRTDFDKLILEIWTDGTIRAKEALELASQTLARFFKQIYKPVFEEVKKSQAEPADNEVLRLTVEELNLPTRIANALRRGGYGTVRDLTEATKEEIIKVKNLGKKSFQIIIKKLGEKGVGIKK